GIEPLAAIVAPFVYPLFPLMSVQAIAVIFPFVRGPRLVALSIAGIAAATLSSAIALFGEAIERAPSWPLRFTAIAGGAAGLCLVFYLLSQFTERLRQSLDRALESEHAQKLAEVQQRFFSDASARLARSLDPREMLGLIAELVVERFADWCVIDL